MVTVNGKNAINEPFHGSVPNNNDKKIVSAKKNQTIPHLKNSQRSFTCGKVTNLKKSLIPQ